jgi:hypothetical protein
MLYHSPTEARFMATAELAEKLQAGEKVFAHWCTEEGKRSALHGIYFKAFDTLHVSGLPAPEHVSTSYGLDVSWKTDGGHVGLHYDHIHRRWWWQRCDREGDEMHSARGTFHECLGAVLRELTEGFAEPEPEAADGAEG